MRGGSAGDEAPAAGWGRSTGAARPIWQKSRIRVSCDLDYRLGAELIEITVQRALALRGMQHLRDLMTHLFERRNPRGAAFDELGDVVPERRPKGLADLAGRQGEHHLFELRHHRAAAEETEISPVAGAIRKLIRQLGKVGSTLQLAGDLLDGCAGCRLIRSLIDVAYDVRGAHRLGCMKLGGVFLVIFADLLAFRRSEERRVGKECRSRWSPYH